MLREASILKLTARSALHWDERSDLRAEDVESLWAYVMAGERK